MNVHLGGQQKADIDGASISETKKKIFTSSTQRGWMLLGYEGNKIVVVASGEGSVSDMVHLLKDDQVQYVLVRIPDEKDGTSTLRDIAIYWTGPKVKPLERGKKKFHFDYVAEHLAPVHASLQALSSTNFNEATIRAKSNSGSGTHVIE
eukprot:TRINITY_DN3734_c0_g1_i1.p1 TRINITY_DN3734_c0_g1~~TRINITY_DN3734_c0_g1_i1.p1  ORF type:complete len:149 (-),score=39.02 TRINITY_DN3734_c0_g1_i1:48-494(-)